MMCHFSSECEGCCKTCKDPCNGGQVCSLGDDPVESIDRLQAWRGIIKECQAFKELKRFIR